eukprot:tig00020610_g11944.t1
MENVKRTTLPAGAAPFEAFEEEFKKALKDPASKGNTGTAIERTLLKLGYSDVSLEKLEPAEILRQDVSAYTKQVILGLQGKALVTSYTNPPQRVLLEQMELKEIPRNVFSTIRNPDPAQPSSSTRRPGRSATPECRIDDFEKICIDTMNVAAAPLLPIAREGEQARVLDGEAARIPPLLPPLTRGAEQLMAPDGGAGGAKAAAGQGSSSSVPQVRLLAPAA